MHSKESTFNAGIARVHNRFENPRLRWLFYEFTLNCNEHCKHCGSNAGDACIKNPLTAEEFNHITDTVAEDFVGKNRPTIVITGGEPLLRKDFFDITEHIRDAGLTWGMTTNATLITPEVAKKLHQSKLCTVGISIDGLRDTHDSFRRRKGGYDEAMRGVNNLIDEDFLGNLMITTVCTHENVHQLPELFEIFAPMKLDCWRIINIDPIGRANDYPELLMTPDDIRYMFDFIKAKRQANYSISYGCAHYLGFDWEYETRDFGFGCMAGTEIASITIDGTITACLDIPRNPLLVQGDIRKQRFSDVWRDEFKIFRDPHYKDCEKCNNCKEQHNCLGDAFHTWNFDEHRPNVCFKDVLGF